MKVLIINSKKVNAQGRSNVLLLIRRRIGSKVVDMRAKTNIDLDIDRFDIAGKTIKEYRKNILNSPDVAYNKTQIKRVKDLIAHIENEFNTLQDPDQAQGKWLANVVDAYLHPNKEEDKTEKENVYSLMLQFINGKNVSIYYKKNFLVMARSVARYEMYVRMTDKTKKAFVFDVDTISADDVEGYKDYITNEYDLYLEQPKTFAKILASYPTEIAINRERIERRGSNAVFKLMKLLKTFFKWANGKGKTNNYPFTKIEIGKESYAEPWYLEVEERDLIADTPMPTKALEVQRDIFTFQCLVGCRVSDLTKLTLSNIHNGILIYVPHKTKDEGEQALIARVPLNEKAQELVDKYQTEEWKDNKGRLFPFISDQKYNEAIKKILTIANVTRNVDVRNSLTGEIEKVPINQVISSHAARRTFVGALYDKVQDTSVIGAMSGHTQGSKAINRYYKIKDDVLRETIKKL